MQIRPSCIVHSPRSDKGERSRGDMSGTRLILPPSASGGVYTAYQVGTNLSVAVKQMNLEQQPKKVRLPLFHILISSKRRFVPGFDHQRNSRHEGFSTQERGQFHR